MPNDRFFCAKGQLKTTRAARPLHVPLHVPRVTRERQVPISKPHTPSQTPGPNTRGTQAARIQNPDRDTCQSARVANGGPHTAGGTGQVRDFFPSHSLHTGAPHPALGNLKIPFRNLKTTHTFTHSSGPNTGRQTEAKAPRSGHFNPRHAFFTKRVGPGWSPAASSGSAGSRLLPPRRLHLCAAPSQQHRSACMLQDAGVCRIEPNPSPLSVPRHGAPPP